MTVVQKRTTNCHMIDTPKEFRFNEQKKVLTMRQKEDNPSPMKVTKRGRQVIMGPKAPIQAASDIWTEGINAKGMISSPNTIITSQCDSHMIENTSNRKERKRWNLNKLNEQNN
jgi:hypothetical protein